MNFRPGISLACALTAVTLAFGSGSAAASGTYPSRAIHIIVPWKAGGGTDAIGRAFAQALKQVSGREVVVDDISGASGAIGSVKAAHARPDGYTLLENGDADMNADLVFRHEPYSLANFIIVSGIYDSPTWLLANAHRGYSSFADFAKAVKEHPGRITVGVGGAEGALMLMAATIRGITGLDYRIIPYSGGADLKKALIGNQVDAGVIHAPVLLPEIEAGLMKVLATGRPLTRVDYAPIRDTKTLRQLGMPVDFENMRVLMAPKGTPKRIIEKLETLSRKAVASSSYRAFGKKFGFAPEWMSGPQATKAVYSQLKSFKQVKAKYIH